MFRCVYYADGAEYSKGIKFLGFNSHAWMIGSSKKWASYDCMLSPCGMIPNKGIYGLQ